MSEHNPDGTTLCVHSVVTEGGHRRKQIGTKTLKAYVQWVVRRRPEVERVLLLCKRELIGFYEGVGFRMVGPSEVEHGADQWYEMSMKKPRSPRGRSEGCSTSDARIGEGTRDRGGARLGGVSSRFGMVCTREISTRAPKRRQHQPRRLEEEPGTLLGSG